MSIDNRQRRRAQSDALGAPKHVSQGEPRPFFDYEGKQLYMRTNYTPEALLKRYKIRLAAPRPTPRRGARDEGWCVTVAWSKAGTCPDFHVLTVTLAQLAALTSTSACSSTLQRHPSNEQVPKGGCEDVGVKLPGSEPLSWMPTE